jgi:hypothetical protein
VTHIPKLDPDIDLLGAALEYAGAGLYIGPLIPGKNPGSILGKGWPAKTSKDPRTIIGWFAGKMAGDIGIFLHVGRSGLWVADVDDPEKLHPTLRAAIDRVLPPYQATRSDQPGRGHYVFRQPEGRQIGNSNGALGDAWGEGRGTNGVVVLEPTLHVEPVGCYRWDQTGRVPVLPDDVAALLADAPAGADAVDDATMARFLAAHTATSDPGMLQPIIDKFRAELDGGEVSRHKSAVKHACWAAREAAAGYFPATEAFDQLRDMFVESMAQPREGGRDPVAPASARAEWAGIVAWAVGQDPAPAESEPVEAVALAECIARFQRWLHLPDPGIVITTVGAAAANLIPGDPLWLLMVGPPSSAKTECVSALTPLPYVYPAAKVTEASLLSGTPPKEHVKAAKGGLLRQIGDFGIMLVKDFTSVLAQNRDTRAEALAALREVFDGRWDRPVGTGGGITLSWSGKCGLIGGCTPTIDRHHAVMGTLGERFLFYRVNVDDPDDQASRRLGSRRHETDMRRELADAVAGVLAGVDTDADIATDPDEDRWLVSLAVWTAKARTPVERDGYSREVVVMPESEGPARIVTQLGAMRDGLAAIGAPLRERWCILHKLAWDAMPAMRREVLQALQQSNRWAKRAELMDVTDIPRAPIERELEDLVLIGLADRQKAGDADNHPWQYRLSSEARRLWPNAAPICTGGPVEDDS